MHFCGVAVFDDCVGASVLVKDGFARQRLRDRLHDDVRHFGRQALGRVDVAYFALCNVQAVRERLFDDALGDGRGETLDALLFEWLAAAAQKERKPKA